MNRTENFETRIGPRLWGQRIKHEDNEEMNEYDERNFEWKLNVKKNTNHR